MVVRVVGVKGVVVVVVGLQEVVGGVMKHYCLSFRSALPLHLFCVPASVFRLFVCFRFVLLFTSVLVLSSGFWPLQIM